MKKLFCNPVYALRASLLLAMISSPVLADTTQQDQSHDLGQKIKVEKGVLVPFEQNPGFGQGFFVIENKSSHDLLLQGISSSACDHVSANHSDDLELSDQTGGDNIFKHLAIPRKSVMVFPKEGYHLICYGLKPIKKDQTNIAFTFYFRGDVKVTADFTYKAKEDTNKVP